MDNQLKKICIVYTPSFSRCFSPLMTQRNPLSPFVINEDDYIAALRKNVQRDNLPWCISKDTTCADSTAIIQQGYDAIVVTPGLKLMFARGDIPKNKILHLDYFGYCSKNVDSAIAQLKTLLSTTGR